MKHYAANHRAKSVRLILETVLVFMVLIVLIDGTLKGRIGGGKGLLWVLAAAQGLWLYRLYVLAHETVHRRLFPKQRRLNDALGAVLLVPLMIPLNVYRKIHRFHHGQNRKDHHTSALETVVSRGPTTLGTQIMGWARWILAVFAGGWFLHGLVSVLLFVFVPPPLAPAISPAFKGWRWRDQILAILGFGVGVGFHVAIALLLSPAIWWWMFGLPLLLFAWIYSLFLYIYHYRTSYGPPVGQNARSLQNHWFFSWLLLNFNQHITHHSDPSIPWYALPDAAQERGDGPSGEVQTLWQAVTYQLRGPVFVEEDG